MNLTWDLEKIFPTEKQKYKAYKSLLFTGLGLELLNFSFAMLFDTDIIGIFIMIYVFIALYINIYIFYKSKILSTLFKMLISITVSFMLSMFIATIVAAGDPMMKLVMLPVIAIISLIVAGIANRKRWAYVRANFRYIWILVAGSIIILISKLTLFFMLRKELQANEILALGNYFGNLLLIVLMIYFYQNEERKGIKFYNVTYMTVTVPLTLFFLLFSWITIVGGSLFKDNIFLNNSNLDLANTDINIDDNSFTCIDTNIEPNITDDSIHGIMKIDNYSGAVFGNGFEAPTVAGLGVFSAGNTLNFGDTSVPTTIDIPEFQSNPYMLFTTNPTANNFHVADANGMTQISVVDGKVYDATHTVIGGLTRNPVNGVTTLNTLTNEPIMSMDCQNNIYAGTPETGHLVGRMDQGVAANTLRDMSGGIVSYTDHLGNTYGIDGKPLGSIRNI